MIKAVDSLTQGIPEVVASETDSQRSSSRWVRLKRQVTAESTHPCPAGVSKHAVRIAGAVSMHLSFHPNTMQIIQQGGTINIYGDEDCTKEYPLSTGQPNMATDVRRMQFVLCIFLLYVTT